jgi:glycosyltransferase involved in cell wall biosynthesis
LITGLTYMNLMSLWANLLSGHVTRVLITEHGYTDWGGPESPNRREKLLPFLTPIFYPRADAIVAVSKGLAHAMAKHLALTIERIHVIYNPILTPEMDQMIHEEFVHPWQAPEGVPVILAAGRLEPVKDYPTLLRAFVRLLQHRQAHLMILGQGSERQALESLAVKLGVASKIEMPGFVQNPLKYMHRAQVLVVSSTFEGFGNTLVEALACGTQVVSTECPGGPAEILADGEYGRLVPVGDPEALAGAIEAALDHPIPSEKLVARASLFSMENATEQYLDLIFPGHPLP